MKFSPRLKIGIIIVFLIAFFTALNYPSITKEVKNFFYLISSPIQKTLWGAGDRVSDFFATISEIKNFKKENEGLKLKIQELLSENISLKELKTENETLREALDIGLEKEFKLIIAHMTGINTDINPDFIFIDKGSKDNIVKDLPVITQQKMLVGRIGEVNNNFSKVILISNKESSFVGKITDTDIFGEVNGKGNFKIFFERIPKEKEIKDGDLVITTPLGRIFPEGLLVGQVQEIKKSDVEPFQTAKIQPTFNIADLEELFIITEW